ncbi:Topoisomerase 1-associated factor [Trichinella pseudospiralis]
MHGNCQVNNKWPKIGWPVVARIASGQVVRTNSCDERHLRAEHRQSNASKQSKQASKHHWACLSILVVGQFPLQLKAEAEA